MGRKELPWTVICSLAFAALMALAATCWLGCGRTSSVLPTDTKCPSGTHQLGDVCVADSNDGDDCGAGTHWDPEVCEGDGACGKCIANPATPPPPTEQLTCGEGTLEIAGKCIPDEVPPPCSGDPGKNSFCAIGPFGGALYLPGKMLCLEGLLQCTLYCGGSEICGNGVDDDCDGQVDEGCPCGPTATVGAGCSGNHGVCAVNGVIECTSTNKPVCSTDLDGSQSKAVPEICGDGLDNNCNGLTDEGCSYITVRASKDTPTSQTLVMGSTGVELLRFEIEFDSQEEVTLDTVTIKDEMSGLQNGSLKNFKLMNGAVEYAGVSALSITSNATFGEFGGMGLKWMGNGKYAVTLNIKADITAADDGGMPSSHRLRVTQVTATTKSGAPVKVTISTGANEPAGNWMMLVRAKLSVSVAADSPSGFSLPAAEQIIAKFTFCNSANVGNYSADINHLNVGISQKEVYPKGMLNLRVYTDSVAQGNIVLNSSNVYTGTITYNIYGTIPAIEVLAGSCRNLIVTLDTANATFGAGNSLQTILPADGLGWGDGVGNYNTVDSLPLSAPPLTF